MAEAEGVKLQQALKAKSIADLRGVSSDKIVAAAQAAGVRAGPDIDGYYLPESVDAIFAAGKQSDVAVLTGATANDIGTNPPIRAAKTLAEYKALAEKQFGPNAAAFLKLYPARNDAEAVRQADQVGRNSGFTVGARAWAQAQTKTGKAPAYLFIVSRVQPFTPGATFSDFDPMTAGAYHMGDVPYFLGTYEAFNTFRKTRDWTAWDKQLSNDMADVIIAFAKTGAPSTAAVKFTRYNPANEVRIDFGDTITSEKLYSKGLDFIAANPAPMFQPPAPAGPAGAPPGTRF
jgi:para-nitrobenzyl esterase